MLLWSSSLLASQLIIQALLQLLMLLLLFLLLLVQVKDIMIENIEKVLDRGEKLDLLVDKTELLQGEAFAFRREAKRARRVMWWKVGDQQSGFRQYTRPCRVRV